MLQQPRTSSHCTIVHIENEAFCSIAVATTGLLRVRNMVNPLSLMGIATYSATSNNMKLVIDRWAVTFGTASPPRPLLGPAQSPPRCTKCYHSCNMLHLVQRARPGPSSGPPSPLLAVPNVTAHPSTASAPMTALLHNDPLLWSSNIPVKGLTMLAGRLTGLM